MYPHSIANGPVFGGDYAPYFYQSGRFLAYQLGTDKAPVGTPAGAPASYDLTSDLDRPRAYRHRQTVEQIVSHGYLAIPKSDPETALIADKNHTAWLGLEAEAWFEQYLGQNGDDGLISLLQRLRWKRPFLPSPQAETEPDAQRQQQRDVDAAEDDIPPVMEIATFREQESAGGRHWLAEALEIPDKPLARPHDQVITDTLRRHLAWVGRDTSRRAIGCSTVLLPESEQELRQEIAHYTTTGSLKACAVRNDTTSPYRRQAV